MCILFIAVKAHPTYPLIVCANRDEFHHRPTQPAHYWPSQDQQPAIIAGKDLQAGGTWLGITQTGQFAALTNIRTTASPSAMRSRGELVLHALQGKITEQSLQQHAHLYPPFNLVYQQQQQLFCFNSVQGKSTPLTQGFYAVSNGSIDDYWPKMARGEQQLEQAVLSNSPLNIEDLIQIMLDGTQADDSQLPSTGISTEWEKRLSSIFITHPEYGTRSTSIILQDIDLRTVFTEVRYDGKGRNLGKQQFSCG